MTLYPGFPSRTTIKEVDDDDLDEEMVISWLVYGIRIYRAKSQPHEAGRGRAGTDTGCHNPADIRIEDTATRRRVKEEMYWSSTMLL